ncbi:MAG: 16S rRNA processing protein RimM [Bacteroidetes bacterium]|nr:16S rRNA processing protein RimM [Bacteroidota bacterium]
MTEFIEIGYTKKAHGVKGELKVVIEDEYLEDFLTAPAVFLELGGGKVPFFLNSIREAGSILAAFENYDSREKATQITGKKMFLRAADVEQKQKPEPVSDLQFAHLKGFKLHDINAGLVGEILDVEEYPQQEMAVIEYKGNSLLIPLHEDLIDQIDKDKKEIHCSLPEGLLEL